MPRNGVDGRRCGALAIGMRHRRQAVAVAAGIDERVDVGEARAQARHGVGHVVGRQQAGVAAQQGRGEADREAIAVAREIEHRAGRRQPLGERKGVGEEGAARDRRAGAPREGLVERTADECDLSHAARRGSA